MLQICVCYFGDKWCCYGDRKCYYGVRKCCFDGKKCYSGDEMCCKSLSI